MTDSFELERRRMVEGQLRRRGISDERVLDAFLRVPRHRFVAPDQQHEAYRDSPLPIGLNQTISQPYMVATMTEKAELRPSDRVLEIGTGSGYQAAILALLCREVYTVERHSALSLRARTVLGELGYSNIYFKVDDGNLGWRENAPFDAIIVTAGAPTLPRALVAQLAESGRLVIPIDEGVSQVLYVIRKTADGISRERWDRCSFVPLVSQRDSFNGGP